MKTPLVTVVMCAYNSTPTIGAAVSSLLTQTYQNWELIVVDDGSTDGTAGIVSSCDDSRVRLLGQENAGPASARNYGIRESSGELIAFVDSDDILFEGYLAAALEVWLTSRGIVSCNAYKLLADGIHWGRTRHPGVFPPKSVQRLALMQSNYVAAMSMFPSSLIRQVGYLDESLWVAEDWEFWLRAVLSGYRVDRQPRPLALLRRSGRSLSTDRARMYRGENEVLTRIARRGDLTDIERLYLSRRLRLGPPGVYVDRAHDSIARGHLWQAARDYRIASTLAPFETSLTAKAAAMTVAPYLVGPVLRGRVRGV